MKAILEADQAVVTGVGAGVHAEAEKKSVKINTSKQKTTIHSHGPSRSKHEEHTFSGSGRMEDWHGRHK